MTTKSIGATMKELKNTLIEEFKDKETAHIYINEFLNEYIATQIKVLREQRELTQKELADLCDMKQSRISVLENVNYDKWSISTLKRLAEAFDVTLKVSFESFSSRIQDVLNINRVTLERLSRENDLACASEQKETIASAGSLQVVLPPQVDQVEVADKVYGVDAANTELALAA